uniref:Uncharacterized protein n=1 Tax=Arundo donax TaxID=35708 RepID=A0A0A9B0D3_ARUDO
MRHWNYSYKNTDCFMSPYIFLQL